MAESVERLLTVRFEGGLADKGMLDSYDGGEAVFGMSKSIRIVSHFFVTQQVRFQAPSASAARVYLIPPRRGSYIQEYQIVVDSSSLIAALGVSALGAALYDVIKYSFRRTLGDIDVKPQTDFVSKLATEYEPHFDSLSESLDGPLLQAHRTVRTDNQEVLVETGDGLKIVELNKGTLRFLQERIVNDTVTELIGNVSSYSVNTTSGRFYVNDLGRTVPFEVDRGFKLKTRAPLSWSLDQRNTGKVGEIAVECIEVRDLAGRLKKIFLRDCRIIT